MEAKVYSNSRRVELTGRWKLIENVGATHLYIEVKFIGTISKVTFVKQKHWWFFTKEVPKTSYIEEEFIEFHHESLINYQIIYPIQECGK